MNNCVICGARLLKVRWTDEMYCPNHGIISENQEPKRFEPHDRKEND
jgi:rRNA maturation protein Nop10